MLTPLSIGTLLFIVPSLLLIYIIATLLLIPYIKVKSYKKQDSETIFFPILGYFKWLDDSFAKYKDMFATTKNSSQDYPNQKYFVSNLQDKVLFNLRDPQYIKEFLQKPQLYEKCKFLDTFRYSAGRGLVFAEGDMWKAHRRFVSKSFHYEFLKANTGMVQETAREFFDKLKPEELNNYSAISRLQDLTGEIVGRIFFGKNLKNYTLDGQPLTVKLAEQGNELSYLTTTPLMLLLGPKIMKKMPFFNQYREYLKKAEALRAVVRQIIQDRRAQDVQENDFLGMLLKSQNEDDLKERYSDEDIIDEFITFFVAGMDTTSHLIGMTIYNLTQHPELMQELKEERDALYNLKPKVEADAVNKMDVLHMHLKETLRMHTPAPFTFMRSAVVDHKIQDIQVRKGDYIQPDFMYMFFNETYFKNPQEYNPNRWRDPDVKIDPYAYTPFSAGPRNCIGQHLAIIESKIIISEFLNRFDFKLKEGYKLEMTVRFLHEPFDELLLDLKAK